MKVEVEHYRRVVAVVLTGDIDAAGAPELRQRLEELLAGGEHNFVIDLSGVPFMDSSGLATLVQLFKRVRIGSGDVRLCGLQPKVRRVLELIRLDRVFDVLDDRGAGVASFPAGDDR